MTTGSVLPRVPRTCGTCPYWIGLQHAEKAACRRAPPTAGQGYEKLWPVTLATEWCGEHPERRKTALVAQVAAAVAKSPPAGKPPAPKTPRKKR